MKRTLFLTIVMTMLITAFCSIPGILVPKSNATGSITACWSPDCPTAPQNTFVLLKDAQGNTVASCEITKGSDCCSMQGDFPTGTYYFEYWQPSSPRRCKSPEFYFLKDTDVAQSTICVCP